MLKARIIGISGHLPERIDTNEDLARENPDWDLTRIFAKTGIAARRIAATGETAADLGFQAAAKLLSRQLVPIDEIDYLLVSTETPDHLLPPNACLLQERLKLGRHIGAFDFTLACSGYVFGLQLAGMLVETRAARNVLLITADTYSKLIHPKDRAARTLFGDGAAATLIGGVETDADSFPGQIGQFVYGTDGSGALSLTVPAGGFRLPRSAATAAESQDAQACVRSQDHLFMDGQAVFSFALNRVPAALAALLKKSGLKPEQIDWYVYHQANKYMLENLAACSRIPPAKMVYHLETLGNTVSASIPLAIEEYADLGRIQPGQRLVLAGFGVGFSWALCWIIWGGPGGRG